MGLCHSGAVVFEYLETSKKKQEEDWIIERDMLNKQEYDENRTKYKKEILIYQKEMFWEAMMIIKWMLMQK